MTGTDRRFSCPSAQPDMDGAQVFGVILGEVDEPMVSYLQQPVAPGEVSAFLHGEEPTRVLRFAAPCEESRCVHHDGASCTLGSRVANYVPAVVHVLPRCAVRSTCRWFAEQGRSVCLRCPQVVTLDGHRPGNSALASAAQQTRES